MAWPVRRWAGAFVPCRGYRAASPSMRSAVLPDGSELSLDSRAYRPEGKAWPGPYEAWETDSSLPRNDRGEGRVTVRPFCARVFPYTIG